MSFPGILTRLRGDTRGTAAVEFAFLLGPLLILMFGAIEVSRFVWVQNALHETAISGARCMGIRADACASADDFDANETTGYIQQTASSWGLSVRPEEIVLEPDAGCGNASGFSRVAINRQFMSVLTIFTEIDMSVEACFPNQI